MEHTEDLGVSGEKLEELYVQLMDEATPTEPNQAVQRLGKIIDLAGELGRQEGTMYAINECRALIDGEIETNLRIIVHYFISNAWENARVYSRAGWDRYAWEQPEIAEQIIHLRSALVLASESVGQQTSSQQIRTCQILTNLGNL